MKKLICSLFFFFFFLTLSTSPINAEDTGESSGGTVILPTAEPTEQQSDQSKVTTDETSKDTPASPGATAEASADPSATPTATTDVPATTSSADTEKTIAPKAAAIPEASAEPTPEATADSSASLSSAPVFKAPATSTATLEQGIAFNVAIMKLAGNSDANPHDLWRYDTSIQAFTRSSAPASGVTTADISASQNGSIVAWFDSSTGTVYWYSKADKIMLNANSDQLFYRMKAIKNIDTKDFDTSKVTSMSDMFSYCESLTSLDVSNWKTSNVTDMYCMFYHCESLTSLDVSNWNTSNVTNMKLMFDACKSLTSLDVTKWNTSNVTNMNQMFISCESLTSLDVSKWNTSNVTDMFEMFKGCKSLTTIDVSNWNTKAQWMGWMFENCSGLKSITFGSNFKYTSFDAENIFPTPSTTVSGVKSNGKWGRDSEMASQSYDAVGLGHLGLTSSVLKGTWYAQRDAIITFDSNGGTLPDESKRKSVMVHNTYGELPVPTFTGHNFTGWFTSAASDGIPATADTVCKGDTTLYALWDAKTYLFKFDINYHKAGGAPDDMPVQFGNPIPQPDLSNMANYEGVIFSGWYLDPECTREFTLFGDQLDKEIVDDYFGTETTLTLYAGWKAAAAPSATPSATASTHSKTSNGSIFFPITSAQKFIPATGAGGGNNN